MGTESIHSTFIETLIDGITSFIGVLMKALIPGFEILFVTSIGLLILWYGYQIVMGQKQWKDLIRPFLFAIIAWIMLGVQGQKLSKSIIDTTFSVSGGLASAAINSGTGTTYTAKSGSKDGGDQKKLSTVLYGVIGKIDKAVSENFSSLGWRQKLGYAFMFVIFIIGFFIQLIVFVCYIVMTSFQIMLVGASIPFISYALIFSWGEQIAYGALKMLLNAILTLFFVAVAMGLCIHIMEDTIVKKLTDETTPNIFTSGEGIFLIAALISWVGIIMMFQASKVADALTNTSGGSSAAGSMLLAGASFGLGKAAKVASWSLNAQKKGREKAMASQKNSGGQQGGGSQPMSAEEKYLKA